MDPKTLKGGKPVAAPWQRPHRDRLMSRALAFLFARESLEGQRLGPALKRAFGGVYIVNDGLTAETAQAVLSAGEADAVSWGKLFIANPDLPRRLIENLPIAEPNRETFYSGGDQGYIDYPALETTDA